MKTDRLGPYEIQRKLGSGGMAAVYLGRHTETGREAAVKVLPASLAREPGFVERFNREIEALQKLSNRHVVELYDHGIAEDDVYYYAMEYVEGDTLTDILIRERRLPWRRVIEIAVQVCVALKAAHDAGIVHRDLKPSNLMITAEGLVKLTDFGVAQMFAANKLTATGGIIGTAEYMSPEQAKGQRASKKSDLYSLGAVIYVGLTGRPPFTGKTSLEVIHKHQYGQFSLPSLIVSDIPHWLEDIVCQLLEKNPDDRFPDAYVLSRALQDVVRKVDFAIGEATLPAENTNQTDEDDASFTMDDQGPSPATLMRDLVRGEIEAQHRGTWLSETLNNTWVLVGLLLLLIAGGLLWFKSGPAEPEERFLAAVALLNRPEGSDWILARDEYLLPLAQADPERWQDKVEPYLKQIEIYELKTELASSRRRKAVVPRGEPERLLMLAQNYRDVGDLPRAEHTLMALTTLLSGDSEWESLYNLSRQLLDEVRQLRSESLDHGEFLKSVLARAEALTNDGQREHARELWQSVIDLYADDPSAREFVERARTRLHEANGSSHQ
jgi:predicted Ser/Thr protein kinase/tetratricopeptide (TPR) repeat protein